MMKKVLAVILSVAMIIAMLPAAVFAETAECDQTINFCTNGGSGAINLLNKYKVNGAADSTWDNDTRTLVLKGIDLLSTVSKAIELPEDTTVVLADNTVNAIDIKPKQFSTSAIYCNGNLIITGEGTLNCNMNAVAQRGIAAGNISLEGGTYNIKGYYSALYTFSRNGTVKINRAKVSAEGSDGGIGCGTFEKREPILIYDSQVEIISTGEISPNSSCALGSAPVLKGVSAVASTDAGGTAEEGYDSEKNNQYKYFKTTLLYPVNSEMFEEKSAFEYTGSDLSESIKNSFQVKSEYIDEAEDITYELKKDGVAVAEAKYTGEYDIYISCTGGTSYSGGKDIVVKKTAIEPAEQKISVSDMQIKAGKTISLETLKNNVKGAKGELSFYVKNSETGDTYDRDITEEGFTAKQELGNVEIGVAAGEADINGDGKCEYRQCTSSFIIEIKEDSITGTIERAEWVGGDKCIAVAEGDTITFSGTVAYVPEDNNPAGNRVGVIIRKPDDITIDSDVKVTMQGIEHTWAKEKVTFGLFPNISEKGESIEIRVDWTENDSQTFVIKAADDIILEAEPVAQIQKEDGTVSDPYSSLQEAIDAAGEKDNVKIISDNITLEKPLVIDGKLVQLWQNNYIRIKAGKDFTGESMIIIKNGGYLAAGEIHLDGQNIVQYGIRTVSGEYRAGMNLDNCSFRNFTEYGAVFDGCAAALKYCVFEYLNGKGGVHLISGSTEGNGTEVGLIGCDFKDIVFDENFNRYKPAASWDMIIADSEPEHTDGYSIWEKDSDGIYKEKRDPKQFTDKIKELSEYINTCKTISGKYSENKYKRSYKPEDELVVKGNAGMIFYLDEHGNLQNNGSSKYMISHITGVNEVQTPYQAVMNMIAQQEKILKIAEQEYATDETGYKIIESVERVLNDIINGHKATDNENYETIAVKICNAVVSGSKTSGRLGEEITVELSLDTNPGIASMLLELKYDDNSLELISAENGEIFGKSSFLAPENNSGDAKVLLWQNSTITDNISTTGELAVLKFKIKDNTKPGESRIDIICDYDKNETIDIWGESVEVETNAATVNIREFAYGDVDNDGSVDLVDALRLKRYLAKWQGYNLTEARAADLDGDGKITLRDMTILERHIAGWSKYAELPVRQGILPLQ